MFFDIQENNKPLIKAILNSIQKSTPCDNQVQTIVNTTQFNVSHFHVDLVVEQLRVFGFVESINQRLCLTFNGCDLLSKLHGECAIK